MIDAKSFMEFFEKEYGVEFVDVSTNKPTLDIIKEQRVCTKCKYCASGDGVHSFVEDTICVNSDSDYVTEFRTGDDTCELWESAKNEDT